MSADRIVKNIGSGLLAQLWSVALGLVVLPVMVRGLGADRYGLLALCFALIGFASMADLGVGRAASKYLAEDFERNECFRTQRYVNTALTVSAVMGLLGTLLLVWAAPLLIHHVFRIPANMEREATVALWLTAAGLPPLLQRILFDGVLAGHHRITLLSFGNIVANTLKAGLTVAAILMGYSLIGVVLANVLVSYLHAGVLWWFTRVHFSGRVKIRPGWDLPIAQQLLTLGTGSTLSWLMGYVLFLYTDRFLIATFLPLAFLGYYTAALDITAKQCYVSNSVSQALFPEFSGKAATDVEGLERRYLQATKALAVGATGICMLLVVFGRELLTYWISPEFGLHSSAVMSVLSLGILISCYVTIPYTAIVAGAGRPSVCARYFALAIALHVGASLLLIRPYQALGVAAAFGFAYLFVFISCLVWVTRNLISVPLGTLFRQCFLGAWITSLTLGITLWFLARPLVHSLMATFTAILAGYMLYLALCAAFAYTPQELIGARRIGQRVLGGIA
jgi:O-antigen/teichoic acid export membrane protein